MNPTTARQNKTKMKWGKQSSPLIDLSEILFYKKLKPTKVIIRMKKQRNHLIPKQNQINQHQILNNNFISFVQSIIEKKNMGATDASIHE